MSDIETIISKATQSISAPEAQNPASEDTKITEAKPGETSQEQQERISAVIAEKRRVLAMKAKFESSSKAKDESASKREQELAAREAKIAERERAIEESRGNPIKALQSLGYSYQDATDFVLNNQNLTQDQQLRAVQEEIKKLRSENEEKEKLFAQKEIENAKKQQEKLVEDFKASINQFVSEHPDDYELTLKYNSQHLIFDVIDGYAEKHQKILSTKEASDMVENFLITQIEEGTQTKKLQARLKPAEKDEKKGAEAQAPHKTLSNTTVSSGAPTSGKRISDPVQRAMAALENLQR